MTPPTHNSVALAIILEVEDERWTAAVPDVAAILEKSITLALADLDTGGRTIEVGVRLVDDGTIRGLNRDWRGRDKPTNVLSFPLGAPEPIVDADFPWLLGDIVMSFDTVESESRADEKPIAHHVAHLAIHAALHLIGHDHETDEDADAMEAAETELLAALGIADPYAIRPAAQVTP
jgi:probable rRNA maturation factor